MTYLEKIVIFSCLLNLVIFSFYLYDKKKCAHTERVKLNELGIPLIYYYNSNHKETDKPSNLVVELPKKGEALVMIRMKTIPAMFDSKNSGAEAKTYKLNGNLFFEKV